MKGLKYQQFCYYGSITVVTEVLLFSLYSVIVTCFILVSLYLLKITRRTWRTTSGLTPVGTSELLCCLSARCVCMLSYSDTCCTHTHTGLNPGSSHSVSVNRTHPDDTRITHTLNTNMLTCANKCIFHIVLGGCIIKTRMCVKGCLLRWWPLGWVPMSLQTQSRVRAWSLPFFPVTYNYT